jgi:hypothetical protein
MWPWPGLELCFDGSTRLGLAWLPARLVDLGCVSDGTGRAHLFPPIRYIFLPPSPWETVLSDCIRAIAGHNMFPELHIGEPQLTSTGCPSQLALTWSCFRCSYAKRYLKHTLIFMVNYNRLGDRLNITVLMCHRLFNIRAKPHVQGFRICMRNMHCFMHGWIVKNSIGFLQTNIKSETRYLMLWQ